MYDSPLHGPTWRYCSPCSYLITELYIHLTDVCGCNERRTFYHKTAMNGFTIYTGVFCWHAAGPTPTPGRQTTTQACYLKFKMQVERDSTETHCKVQFDYSTRTNSITNSRMGWRQAPGLRQQELEAETGRPPTSSSRGLGCTFGFRVPTNLPSVV